MCWAGTYQYITKLISGKNRINNIHRSFSPIDLPDCSTSTIAIISRMRMINAARPPNPGPYQVTAAADWGTLRNKRMNGVRLISKFFILLYVYNLSLL